jgi:predicted TIM-barrel fold metal-dependent hydrolase
MDRNELQTGICSLSIPGARFKADNANTIRVARVSNEFGAQMMRDHGKRFGLFATLPFPDVDACLKEIEYALDVLKADGIGMMTSYDGKYPGDGAFKPIFDELQRRKAIVYFHPNSPACCGNVISGVSEGFLEYPYDTGRAILSLMMSGTFARSPDTRFIFSHTGGPIIMLAGRLESSTKRNAALMARMGDNVPAMLKRLYYDTANSAYPQNLAALLTYVPETQILFGSDAPYYTFAENLEELSHVKLTQAQRDAIERDNALRLFPRLKA